MGFVFQHPFSFKPYHCLLINLKSMTKNNLIVLLLIILFTGAGFFAGTKYQQSKIVSQRSQFGGRMQQAINQGNQPQPNRARLGGRQVVGEIINQDEKTITVKLQDGSSKVVLLSDTTSINKASQGSKADLTVGLKVGIFGTENADGSVTAQNIQLNPISREPSTTPIPTK